MSLSFLVFGFFFPFPFSLFLFFLLQGLTFYGASKEVASRWAIFTKEQPGVMAGNFALSISLNFLSIFEHLADHSDLGII